MKAPNTVVGPNDDIHIPPHAKKTDYEVELAVVIGEQCRYLPNPEEAMKAIAGYAISNDVSERAYQLEKGGQWVKGKSFETFNPLGPFLVTPDELEGPQNLNLELRVNGNLRQKSNTSLMIFTPPHIVWYISQFMVLEPGDIVNTGTPPGVGLGMDPPAYLNPGDTLELSITGLGRQSQTCVATSP
jgi:2-keto-4-pentenoate hydratase/2-oxohepta-3-ene-1,7-dioic acid hydratase in catechol pathway